MSNKNLTMTETVLPKRQFLWMKTLDAYILKEFMIIYICCTLGFSMLFMISDMINKLKDFSGTNASFWQIAKYFLLLQPFDIKFVLPIGLLLACMYTLARFGLNNEITAMRASGISLVRCGLSIYCVGFIVTCVNFWFNESLIPNCTREADILINTANNPDYFKIMTRMLMYPSPDNMRRWLIQSFETGDSINGVQIKKVDHDGKLELEIYAKKASYSRNSGWVFKDVDFIKYKEMTLYSGYDEKNLGKSKTVVIPESEKLPVLNSTMKEYQSLGKIIETPRDILNILKPADQLSSRDIIRRLTMTKELDGSTKNSLLTEFYSRLAFPWVCLLSVFLGIPLAGSSARKGVMISIVKAAAVIVVYTVLQQIFLIMGNQGYIYPILAAFVPTLALLGYVIYIVVKHKG